MNKRLSITGTGMLIGLGFLITIITYSLYIYTVIGINILMIPSLLLILALLFWFVLFLYLIRKKLARFSFDICETIDGMMNGEMETEVIYDEELLLSKINHRLLRLYQAMDSNRQEVSKEKLQLQELISDISHQVKTPMSNLKMINATLANHTVPKEKQQELLSAMYGQLEKLDFLMESMIKMSRLESGIIHLSKQNSSIYETIASALGGIYMNAENKQIRVRVNCPDTISIPHDKKWTTEALYNILDNAVKYTQAEGEIRIDVEQWELYTKIDISDTGKGIAEHHQGEIWKRFYREEDVHALAGIGIGLYLTRKIITLQGGYTKVTSVVGKGSTFSVFIPNRHESSQNRHN